MRMRTIVLGLLLSTRLAVVDPEPPTASTGVAIGLSTGALVASYAALTVGVVRGGDDNKAWLIAGGIGALVAPSLGHVYAHDYLTTSTIVRAGSGAALIYGVSRWFKCDESDCSGPINYRGGQALATISLLVFVGSSIYDVATVPRAVRRHNHDELRPRRARSADADRRSVARRDGPDDLRVLVGRVRSDQARLHSWSPSTGATSGEPASPRPLRT